MTTGPTGTEDRLREALDAMADQVHPPPHAYRAARLEWRRRERRRRLILAILIAVVFVVADAIGLWALNRTQAELPVIFNGPPPCCAGGRPAANE